MSSIPSSGEVSWFGMAQEYFGRLTHVDLSLDTGWANARDFEQKINGRAAGATWSASDARGNRRYYNAYSGWPGMGAGSGVSGANYEQGGSGVTTSRPVGWEDVYTGYVDDNYTSISLPFPFRIQGVDYTTAYVGSNGYVTFSAGATVYSSLGAGNPALPKIFIGAGDRNWVYVAQRRSIGYDNVSGSQSVKIRVEGNYPYYSNQTRGTSNSVTELLFVNQDNAYSSLRNYCLFIDQFVDGGSSLFGLYSSSAVIMSHGWSTYSAWVVYTDGSGYGWGTGSYSYLRLTPI